MNRAALVILAAAVLLGGGFYAGAVAISQSLDRHSESQRFQPIVVGRVTYVFDRTMRCFDLADFRPDQWSNDPTQVSQGEIDRVRRIRKTATRCVSPEPFIIENTDGSVTKFWP